MEGLQVLSTVHEWLPVFFIFDLVLFHVIGDHPLAARWWLKRADAPATPLELI